LLAPTSSGTTRYSTTSAMTIRITPSRAGLISRGSHFRRRLPVLSGCVPWPSLTTGTSSLDRMPLSYPVFAAYRMD